MNITETVNASFEKIDIEQINEKVIKLDDKVVRRCKDVSLISRFFKSLNDNKRTIAVTAIATTFIVVAVGCSVASVFYRPDKNSSMLAVDCIKMINYHNNCDDFIKSTTASDDDYLRLEGRFS